MPRISLPLGLAQTLILVLATALIGPISVAEETPVETSPPVPAVTPPPVAPVTPETIPEAKPVEIELKDPTASGLRALLREGVHPKLRWSSFKDVQAALDTLYAPGLYQPIWIRDGKPTRQAAAVTAALAKADDKGLNSKDYDAEPLNTWQAELAARANAGNQEIASFDVALSIATMRYASSLFLGRVNPRHVNFGLDIEPKKKDWPQVLKQLAGAEQPETVLENLEPKTRLYEGLQKALRHYRSLDVSGTPTAFTFPPKFKPGDRHRDVPALRQLLTQLGDLPDGAETTRHTDVYDKALTDAVKHFQSRHGIGADGTIGRTTLEQLNYPLTDRIRQIQLGMERLRWLPEAFDRRYIIVNIPSFELFGFNDGQGAPDLKMNVIVGEAIDGRNTPVFHSDMTYVNFRPYWNVPYKITAKEYLPIVRRNPGYLSSHNLEIVSNFAPNSAVYSASGENIELLATGALKLRQKPGPKNALGLVKFAFPNNNNVYLHSTPSQGLFKRVRRDFSHGCIRVEFPVVLAEWVLKEQGDWTHESIEQAMQGNKSKTVTLKTSIPVYIFYSTVLADENGRVRFFDDIYGHDLILQEVLAKGFPYPP